MAHPRGPADGGRHDPDRVVLSRVAGLGASAGGGRAGFRPASLDAVNLLLADVRAALRPCLKVFLVTQRHWSQTDVGVVTTVGGLLGLAVRTPIGGRPRRGAR
jgi:hypothetical protein